MDGTLSTPRAARCGWCSPSAGARRRAGGGDGKPRPGPGQEIPSPAIRDRRRADDLRLPAISARYEGRWHPRRGPLRRDLHARAWRCRSSSSAAASRPAPRSAGLDGSWEGSVDPQRHGPAADPADQDPPGRRARSQRSIRPICWRWACRSTELARDGQTVSFAVPVGATSLIAATLAAGRSAG